jgi:hypothetical protein
MSLIFIREEYQLAQLQTMLRWSATSRFNSQAVRGFMA